MPPVAGCIKWSRSLFARVKITMQKLQDVGPELLQGETGQEVMQSWCLFGCRTQSYDFPHVTLPGGDTCFDHLIA